MKNSYNYRFSEADGGDELDHTHTHTHTHTHSWVTEGDWGVCVAVRRGNSGLLLARQD